MKIGILLLIIGLSGLTALAQSPPTLRIVTETPGLPSELFYGDVKVKPLRLRPGTNIRITIDDIDFFVQEQYIDFLGRFPDSTGFANWNTTLNGCPNGGFGEFANPNCDRVHVSAGFYQSVEFQGRGYFAYRFYEVGLGRRPLYKEFIPDMALVGGSQSPAQSDASKAVFTDAFVLRPEFTAKYPGLSGQPLANAIWQTAGLPGSPISAGSMTNGQILRAIAETQLAFDKFLNRGFVSMEYFGYLRRDPDTIGYANWVATLDADPSNFRHMIFGFIYSDEYRNRF